MFSRNHTTGYRRAGTLLGVFDQFGAYIVWPDDLQQEVIGQGHTAVQIQSTRCHCIFALIVNASLHR